MILTLVLIGVTVGGSYLFVDANHKDEILTKQNYGENLIKTVNDCVKEGRPEANHQLYNDCLYKMKIENNELSRNFKMPAAELILNTILTALSNVIPSIIVVISLLLMKISPIELGKLPGVLKFISRNSVFIVIGMSLQMLCLMKINGIENSDVSNNNVYKEIIVFCTLIIVLISTITISFMDNTVNELLKNAIKVNRLPINRKSKMLAELVTYKEELKQEQNVFSEISFNRDKSKFNTEIEHFVKQQLIRLERLENTYPKKFPYVKKSIKKWNMVLKGKNNCKHNQLILSVTDKLYKDVNFITSTINEMKNTTSSN
ncbi:hypothetical protein [Viridibacillus arvi]|uniref:hypothetical protein n=1 Tax=Viridibacillus arvi TaxID=263475 RepID=UPI0034CE37C9